MTELIAWTAAALLIVAGVAIVRARRTQGVRSETIRVVSSKYLGGKRYPTLVEVDGERLLIGLGGESVTLVARLNDWVAAGAPPWAASARRSEGSQLDAPPTRRAARARGGAAAATGDQAETHA